MGQTHDMIESTLSDLVVSRSRLYTQERLHRFSPKPLQRSRPRMMRSDFLTFTHAVSA